MLQLQGVFDTPPNSCITTVVTVLYTPAECAALYCAGGRVIVADDAPAAAVDEGWLKLK